jgi:hypothetical protein
MRKLNLDTEWIRVSYIYYSDRIESNGSKQTLGCSAAETRHWSKTEKVHAWDAKSRLVNAGGYYVLNSFGDCASGKLVLQSKLTTRIC